MMPANWVWMATGRDPAADLRGTYDTQAGAQRTLLANGGMKTLWADLAGRAGLRPVEGYARGDVGVIRAQVSARRVSDVGAVYLGNLLWATVGQGGGILALRVDRPLAWTFQ